MPSCPVTLRPAGHSGPLGNVLHPARPAPRPHSPGTSWCSTARGRATRVPPATRASRLSRSLDRQQPVPFAPPARLPACLAALPLAAVVPYANDRGGRAELATAGCGHPLLQRLLALLAKVLRRRHSAPSHRSAPV